MKKIKLLTPILGLGLVSSTLVPLSSCKNNNDKGEITPNIVSYDHISVKCSKIELNKEFTITATPDDGYTVGKIIITIGNANIKEVSDYTVSTNDENVVSINVKASAVTNRNITIHISNKEIPQSSKVKLIKFNTVSDQLNLQDRQELDLKESITVKPAEVLATHIKWKSSNESIATVSSDGIVRAASNATTGTVTITASASDGSGKSASIEVTIADITPTPECLTFNDDGKLIFDDSKDLPEDGNIVIPEKMTMQTANGNEEIVIKELPQNAFSALTHTKLVNLKSVRFARPKNIKELGSDCFTGDINLEEIWIPDNITYLADSIFDAGEHNSGNLTKVHISDNSKLAMIGGCAFRNQKKLGLIDGQNVAFAIPKNVYLLQKSTFEGCDNLKLIKFTDNRFDFDNRYQTYYEGTKFVVKGRDQDDPEVQKANAKALKGEDSTYQGEYWYKLNCAEDIKFFNEDGEEITKLQLANEQDAKAKFRMEFLPEGSRKSEFASDLVVNEVTSGATIYITHDDADETLYTATVNSPSISWAEQEIFYEDYSHEKIYDTTLPIEFVASNITIDQAGIGISSSTGAKLNVTYGKDDITEDCVWTASSDRVNIVDGYVTLNTSSASTETDVTVTATYNGTMTAECNVHIYDSESTVAHYDTNKFQAEAGISSTYLYTDSSLQTQLTTLDILPAGLTKVYIDTSYVDEICIGNDWYTVSFFQFTDTNESVHTIYIELKNFLKYNKSSGEITINGYLLDKEIQKIETQYSCTIDRNQSKATLKFTESY